MTSANVIEIQMFYAKVLDDLGFTGDVGDFWDQAFIDMFWQFAEAKIINGSRAQLCLIYGATKALFAAARELVVPPGALFHSPV